ncbi:MAG: hypothetical protein NTX30_11530 [Deltaproteobacteria bacterium]|nr:hypothetical protein [Deltaproteobacteria bacterium]
MGIQCRRAVCRHSFWTKGANLDRRFESGEGYWEWGLYPWDIAAGVVIAREAGCRITSIDGGLLN